jgi:hypothetical protein
MGHLFARCVPHTAQYKAFGTITVRALLCPRTICNSNPSDADLILGTLPDIACLA